MDWLIIQIKIINAMSGYVASRILGGDDFNLPGNIFIFIGVVGGWIGNGLIIPFFLTLP